MRPQPAEYGDFYQNYVRLAKEDHPVKAIENAMSSFEKCAARFTEELGDFRYEEGKWSIKELLAHIIDAERVFTYRALRFARGDTIELPGYEHNHWATSAGAPARTVADLMEETRILRQATILLYRSFDDDKLVKKGIASGSPMSVRALGFIIAGHQLHHEGVIEDRYLKGS